MIVAHPDPHIQRRALELARAGALTSTALAPLTELSLKLASNRIKKYLDRGLIERCGGAGTKANAVRYRLTDSGVAWLTGAKPAPRFDLTMLALLANWRTA